MQQYEAIINLEKEDLEVNHDDTLAQACGLLVRFAVQEANTKNLRLDLEKCVFKIQVLKPGDLTSIGYVKGQDNTQLTFDVEYQYVRV